MTYEELEIDGMTFDSYRSDPQASYSRDSDGTIGHRLAERELEKRGGFVRGG